MNLMALKMIVTIQRAPPDVRESHTCAPDRHVIRVDAAQGDDVTRMDVPNRC